MRAREPSTPPANLTALETPLNRSPRLTAHAPGQGKVTVQLPKLPLLKGRYHVSCFLTTEDGIHPYDLVEQAVTLDVTQSGTEQGLVQLPHQWHCT